MLAHMEDDVLNVGDNTKSLVQEPEQNPILNREPNPVSNVTKLPPRGTRYTRKGPKRGRPGKASIPPERLSRVAELLTRCYASNEIQRVLCKEWGVTHQTIRKYIAIIYREWQRDRAADPEERDRTAAALAERYQQAVEQGDVKSAIKALEVRARLLGLFIDRVQVRAEISGQVSINLEDAERRAKAVISSMERIREKKALAAASNGGEKK